MTTFRVFYTIGAQRKQMNISAENPEDAKRKVRKAHDNPKNLRFLKVKVVK